MGEEGWGRAERRRRRWSWVGVIVSSEGEDGEEEAVLERLLAGGRRDRTDQVGFERSLVMLSWVFGDLFVEGAVDSLTAGVGDSLAAEVVVL